MSELNQDLIADLTRLVRRYPASDWQALIGWLKDQSKRDQAIELLEHMSRASSRIGERRAGRARQPTIGRLLVDKQASDPTSANLLRQFRGKLLLGELLRTSQDLRFFAEKIGVKDMPPFRKREQAINFIFRQLAGRSHQDLVQAISTAAHSGRDFGQEYDHWVELILDRRESG